MNLYQKKILFLLIISLSDKSYASLSFFKKSAKINPTDLKDTLIVDVSALPDDTLAQQTPPPPGAPKQKIRKKPLSSILLDAFSEKSRNPNELDETAHPTSPIMYQKRSGSLSSTDQSLSLSFDKDDESSLLSAETVHELTEQSKKYEALVYSHLAKLYKLEQARKIELIRYNLTHPEDPIADQALNKKRIAHMVEQL
jgi:hypothetical protein